MAQRVLLECTLATRVLQIPIGVEAPSHVRTKPNQTGECKRRQKRVRTGRGGWQVHATCDVRDWGTGAGAGSANQPLRRAVAGRKVGRGRACGWAWAWEMPSPSTRGDSLSRTQRIHTAKLGRETRLATTFLFRHGPRWGQACRAAGRLDMRIRGRWRYACRPSLPRRCALHSANGRDLEVGGGACGFRNCEPEGDAAQVRICPTGIELLASAQQAALRHARCADIEIEIAGLEQEGGAVRGV